MGKVKVLPNNEEFLEERTNVFGDLVVSQDLPVVQIDALNGILPVHETFSATGGSVSWKKDHGGREFQCTTGTSVGGYGLIRSKKPVRYRPGQSTTLRYTARFSSPVALCAQRAGGITSGIELSFGHDGANGFGVLWRTGGRLEVRQLTLTVAASGAETATVTLDGTAYNISLTNTTLAENARTIAISTNFGTTQAWQAYQNGAKVTFIKNSVGSASGTYAYSSTGTSAGGFTTLGSGSAVTDTWIYQDNWDNPSPFGKIPLDPTKGNVYQIEFGYLGYSGIRYYIMHPETNKFVLVHTIKYQNKYQVPHLDNPSFKIGWFAASLGSTTNTGVYGASAAGFISGKKRPLRNPVAHANSKSGVTTTLTNIISIRNRSEFLGLVNLSQIFPNIITAAVEGTKPAIVEVHINATVAGTQNWTYHAESESIVEYDTAGTTVTGGKEVFVIALGKSDTAVLDLQKYDIELDRNDVLTIAAKATTGTTDVSASVTWLED